MGMEGNLLIVLFTGLTRTKQTKKLFTKKVFFQLTS